MSLNVSLPGVRQPVIEAGGTASRPYYIFFQSVATSLQSLSDQIGNVTTTPPEPPISENANVVGKYSIYTRGILKTGIVSVLLIGDVETPGKTQYYGSNADGEKGWHAVSDAMDSTANITLTVGADGVTTFDLADLANSGAGAALVKITRDSKGRISGTSPATTDDLAEGGSLYYTDARSDARVAAGIAAHVGESDPHTQYLTADEVPAVVFGTTGTTATAGTADALPAQPAGYVEVIIGGVAKKLPFYD